MRIGIGIAYEMLFRTSLMTIISDHWYRTFFTAPINAFWEALVPDELTAQEIAFIEKHLRLARGTHVLDVPCGAGRHSLALARNGYRATGVDLSDDVIVRARAAAKDLPVQLLHQDMTQLKVHEQFDGAICMGNSFGYLSHVDTLRFVQSVHDALKPHARWLVDTGMTAESILANLEREARYEVGDFVFEVHNDYDMARSRLLTRTVLRRGDDEWRQGFSHGVYTSGELARIFESVGFEVIARLADLDDKPYALGDRRLLLILKRR
jgi:SAM-dependent methyltransferase